VVSKLILAEEKHGDSLKEKPAFSACDVSQRRFPCPVGASVLGGTSSAQSQRPRWDPRVAKYEEAHQQPTESVVFFRSDHLCNSLKCYVAVYINYENKKQ